MRQISEVIVPCTMVQCWWVHITCIKYRSFVTHWPLDGGVLTRSRRARHAFSPSLIGATIAR